MTLQGASESDIPQSVVWIEEEYFCFTINKTPFNNNIRVSIGNPEYTAYLQLEQGEYRLLSVDAPKKNDQVYISSEVWAKNISNVGLNCAALIPDMLSQGKVKITDYRQVDGRHEVDLEPVIEQNDGFILSDNLTVIFDSTHVLPIETIYKPRDGSPPLHFIQTEFVEVDGFCFPTKTKAILQDAAGKKTESKFMSTSFHPEEKLDRKICYLKHYGLPEPEGLRVTDFGRSKGSRTPWLIGIMVIIFGLLVFLRIQRKMVK